MVEEGQEEAGKIDDKEWEGYNLNWNNNMNWDGMERWWFDANLVESGIGVEREIDKERVWWKGVIEKENRKEEKKERVIGEEGERRDEREGLWCLFLDF